MKSFLKLKYYVLPFGGLAAALAIGYCSPAAAYSFNQNHIIDDGVFNNANTMNAAQIDSFLNGFPNSCISTNSGFTAADPTGYSPSPSQFFYSSTPVSAGTVIYDAAQAYGLNPQVILATLQKEEGLVDGSGPYGCGATAMASAVGYGCTDSGTNTHDYTYPNGGLVTPLYYRNGTAVNSVTGSCVNSGPKAGFSEQLIHATWLLRFSEQRSEGNINWAVIKGNWDNSDDPQSCYSGYMTQGTWQQCPSGGSAYYDGWVTIDNTAVHMDNGATAALYVYTPHFPGNQSFSNIFIGWFGSTTGGNSVGFYDMGGYPSIKAGESATVWIRYTNTGLGPLFDDTTAAGTPPLHLAETNPINRISNFADTSWINSNRPSGTFSAVYESDGTTLAANQHIAQPGQIIKFQFTYTVALSSTNGTYRDYIQPVLEGSSKWDIGGWGFFDVTVTTPDYRVAFNTLGGYPSGFPGDVVNTWISYKNTGSQPLYDNTTVPGGSQPLHLANTNPINRVSQFYEPTSWINNNRPTNQFGAVYESDGVTLAANQHVAQAGQIVRFNVSYKIPFNQSYTTYHEYIQPVLEGSAKWDVGGYGFIDVTIKRPSDYSAKYFSMSNYPTIAKGAQTSVWIEFQNVGAQIWYDDASRPASGHSVHYANTNPINRVSQFYEPTSWINNNRPSKQFSAVYESDGATLAANQHVAQPGQIVKFQFNYAVPSSAATGTYREYLQPVLEGASNWSMGGWGFFDVTVTP